MRGRLVDPQEAEKIMKEHWSKMSDAELLYEGLDMEIEVIKSRVFRPVKAIRPCKRGELACVGVNVCKIQS